MQLIEQHQTITMRKKLKKVKKIRELTKTGHYDADIARYIPGVFEMKFQGMLDDVKELDFQILLKDNYSVNPCSIHLCFSMKKKK